MLISATCNHCVTPHGVASVCSKAGPIVCIRFDSDKGVGEKGSSVLIRKLFFGHIAKCDRYSGLQIIPRTPPITCIDRQHVSPPPTSLRMVTARPLSFECKPLPAQTTARQTTYIPFWNACLKKCSTVVFFSSSLLLFKKWSLHICYGAEKVLP